MPLAGSLAFRLAKLSESGSGRVSALRIDARSYLLMHVRMRLDCPMISQGTSRLRGEDASDCQQSSKRAASIIRVLREVLSEIRSDPCTSKLDDSEPKYSSATLGNAHNWHSFQQY